MAERSKAAGQLADTNVSKQEQTMSAREIYENLLVEVATMQRAELIEQLSHFPGKLQLDFSPAYLEACATDRLRHLLTAALWRCRVRDPRA